MNFISSSDAFKFFAKQMCTVFVSKEFFVLKKTSVLKKVSFLKELPFQNNFVFTEPLKICQQLRKFFIPNA